ncbi:MAG: hypothetical protein ACE5HE_05410 [Phycisphaerae bacterium]
MRVTPADYLLALLCSSALAVPAQATGRRFTYTYEARTMPKGAWEYEQWITWKTAKEADRDFDRFDFRHELEFGITDRLQLAFYLSDWRYEESSNRRRGDWRNVAVEGIYNLTNPVTDPLGLSLYGEVEVGDEKLELEGKLIVEKDIGRIVLAYNTVLEAEWEGHHLDEDNGKIEQSAGLSYQFSPRLMAGIELLHEVEMPDWRGVRGKGILYLGPNVSYRSKGWWATLTPLFQVSDVEEEPDFQMRLIFGIDIGNGK